MSNHKPVWIPFSTYQSIENFWYLRLITASSWEKSLIYTKAVITLTVWIDGYRLPTNKLVGTQRSDWSARVNKVGFAVAADEVRTLAQRTQESTWKLKASISSTTVTCKPRSMWLITVRRCLQERLKIHWGVEQTLQDISGAVSEIFSTVAGSYRQRKSRITKTLLKNVMAVEQKSTESTTGATQTAATAKEQAELATSLKELEYV